MPVTKKTEPEVKTKTQKQEPVAFELHIKIGTDTSKVIEEVTAKAAKALTGFISGVAEAGVAIKNELSKDNGKKAKQTVVNLLNKFAGVKAVQFGDSMVTPEPEVEKAE